MTPIKKTRPLTHGCAPRIDPVLPSLSLLLIVSLFSFAGRNIQLGACHDNHEVLCGTKVRVHLFRWEILTNMLLGRDGVRR